MVAIANLLILVLAAPAARGAVEWAPPEQISAAGLNAVEPQVAASASGVAIAVWNRSDGVNGRIQAAVRPPGGSFGAAQTLSAVGQEAFQPQVAIDPNGNAVAVWTRFDGVFNRIQASSRPAGGSFGAVQTLSVANKNSDSPQVSIDPNGTATAVWVTYDGTGSTSRIVAATRPLGGSFGAEETISFNGQFAFEPQVESEPNGEAVAVWSRFDGAKFRTESSERINRTAPYQTPSTASPAHFALVPVFRQCGTGSNPTNGEHSPPLSAGSCNPPATTAGAMAHVGPQSAGSADYTAVPGNLGTPADEADATVAANVTDVRSGGVGGADYDPNPAGADATLSIRLRITDLRNSTSTISCGTAGICPGTTTDLDFNVPVVCTPTGSSGIGSTCAASTSFDAVSPGAVAEGRASVMQLFRVRLNDSGANGLRGDADDRLFEQQGFYVP